MRTDGTILGMRVQTSRDADETMRERGYVTVRVACERTGRPWPSVYTWAQKGVVKSLQVGRRRYIEWADLVRFVGAEFAEAMGLDATKP